MSYLQSVGQYEDFYKEVASAMQSTISNDKVNFAAYKIISVHKITNSRLKNKYESKQQSMEATNGFKSDVWQVFHGTQGAEQIARDGFDKRLCHPRNRFGRGFYFAPESSKANTYAFGINKGCHYHDDISCTICPRTMVLCYIAVGYVYSPVKFGAPPQGVFDSVHAEPRKVRGLNYDEIAVFHEDQILPIALIKYTITNDAPSQVTNDLEGALKQMKAAMNSETATAIAVGVGVAIAIPAIAYLVSAAVEAFSGNKEEKERQVQRRRRGGRGRGHNPPPQEEPCVIS